MTVQSYAVLLAGAYALLGALLLLCLLNSRLPWVVRAGAVVTVSGFYCAAFFSLQGLQGWSAPVRVPDRFQVLWGRVVEPNPGRNDPGAVHLWLEALDDANLPSGVPRAFLLPYSQALADKVTRAQTAIREGRPQGGRATGFGDGSGADAAQPALPSPGASPGGDASGGGLLDPERLGGQSKMVDLAPLPAPALPPKEEP
jgi:hypothetical protein